MTIWQDRVNEKKYEVIRKEMGAVEVRLYIVVDNIILQELYKKCGMKMVSNVECMKSE